MVIFITTFNRTFCNQTVKILISSLHYVVSDLGLHRSPMFLKKEARLLWVKTCFITDHVPDFQEKIMLHEDVTIARTVCNNIATTQQFIKKGCITQQLFERIRTRIE